MAETTEQKLRKEIEDLKQQLQQHRELLKGSAAPVWHPSGATLWAIFLGVTVLIVIGFLAGYVPLRKRTELIQREAAQHEQGLQRVEVVAVQRSKTSSELELPGSIQAITESPILARADGYIRRRMVDIGDHVRVDQPLAEIEAPEMDQQLGQAKAALLVARDALQQAMATNQQGKTSLELARVTAERWASLVTKGAVSRQENDQYQAQYQAQVANVQALEKSIAVHQSNVAAAEANVARLDQLQSYRVVRAPFEGVVTQRNVDAGALVNAGGTLLFRIAQTQTLRISINVPQANAGFVRTGQPAQLSVANLPGRRFAGTVTRTANALDPATRTLLVEIHVPNPNGVLLPGMFAQVALTNVRGVPPLLIPGNAVVPGGNGLSVAVVRSDHTVHLQTIAVGRDYGSQLEVLDGVQEGDWIIPSPGDLAREGLRVEPVPAAKE
ncbi:MAG TPA: efflux RND transporter periplasmic adaptor subunit [Bryobacteraceae bacterium]